MHDCTTCHLGGGRTLGNEARCERGMPVISAGTNMAPPHAYPKDATVVPAVAEAAWLPAAPVVLLNLAAHLWIMHACCVVLFLSIRMVPAQQPAVLCAV